MPSCFSFRFAILAILLGLPLPAYAQQQAVAVNIGTPGASGDICLQQLKAETTVLCAEASTGSSVSPAATDGSEVYTLDDLRAEMKKMAWTKGDFTITPYGCLWGTATYETQRTNAGDYVLWTYSPTQNAYTPVVNSGDAFHVDAKSTRLGLDIVGPRVPFFDNAVSGGKVEIDFQRTIDVENRATVQLRHAYLEVKNEEFRILVGQTWDVISPLNPGMLMYTVGWDGGNIGYRRPQFRYERYMALSDEFLITAQGSFDVDTVSDTGTGVVVDHSSWPILEGRLAATVGHRGPDDLPCEFGVSSHVGQTAYTFQSPTWANPVNDLERKTWSFNVDMRIPLTHQFGVQGEFFTGENLGAYYGGVGQGIDIGSPSIPGTRNPIRSTGGWFEAWLDFTSQFHGRAGYGIDDPFDQDVTIGRIYNAFIYGNLTYDFTKQFTGGIEVSSWKTLWVNAAPGNSVNTAVVAKYSF